MLSTEVLVLMDTEVRMENEFDDVPIDKEGLPQDTWSRKETFQDLNQVSSNQAIIDVERITCKRVYKISIFVERL